MATTPPTAGDLRLVRAYLAKLLPAELINAIIDHADYFPIISAKRASPVMVSSGLGDHSARLFLISPPLPSACVGEIWKARSVTWRFESHDQGWGGEAGCKGTYWGSFTWFTAEIIRPLSAEAALTPDDDLELQNELVPAQLRSKLGDLGYEIVGSWAIQRNLTADREWRSYTVRWRRGEAEDEGEANEQGRGIGKGFLEALKSGDRVGIYAHAQYSGWVNHVKDASFEIVYQI